MGMIHISATLACSTLIALASSPSARKVADDVHLSQKGSFQDGSSVSWQTKAREGVKQCAARYKQAGKIKLRWVIKSDGSTAGVEVVDEKFSNTKVGECVVRVVSGLTFPKQDGRRDLPVTYPFILRFSQPPSN